MTKINNNNNLLPLKPELKSSIAMSLEDKTTRYINFRDTLFKFSLKRILPIPGYFEPINYMSNLLYLEDLSELLAMDHSRLKKVIGESESVIIRDDRLFLSTSLKYTDKLMEAIRLQSEISEKLHQKTITHKSYSSRQYATDVDTHEALDKEVGDLYNKMIYAYKKQ